MSQALAGVDAVIHSAGIAHAMSGVPEDDYRLLNTEATIRLAQAAQRAGARRFVFLSSIRAQCGPVEDDVHTESLEPQPVDAYGRSKLAAEQGLAALDLDWVALRPVLVYGPGVKGNMAELIRLARSRLPLPFGGLTARRSLLSLDNLVEAVDCVLTAPAPLRRPLVVADPEPLTLPEMVAADPPWASAAGRASFRCRRRCWRRPAASPAARKPTGGLPARWLPTRRRSAGSAGPLRSTTPDGLGGARCNDCAEGLPVPAQSGSKKPQFLQKPVT